MIFPFSHGPHLDNTLFTKAADCLPGQQSVGSAILVHHVIAINLLQAAVMPKLKREVEGCAGSEKIHQTCILRKKIMGS